MTPQQHAYVQRRRRQIRLWPWVATALLGLLLAVYGWLWWHYPLYVSPAALLAELQSGAPDMERLALLAALGNLAFIGCGLFIAALIGVASLALYNEHRLIRLLDQETGPAAVTRQPDADGMAAGDKS